MNVSTSINVMFGQGPVASQMKRVYDAGFRHMDINFNDWVDQKTGNGYFPCSEEQWQDWVQSIRKFSKQYGVVLNQAHGPLFNIFAEGERGDHLREMCGPTLKAAAELGIPWVVYHAGTAEGDFSSPEHVRNLKAENHRFFDPLVNLAEKLGAGIAIENMSDKFSRNHRGVYCAHTGDLVDLVDSFGSKQVGICWDTGHANLQGVNQRKELNRLGSRLKVLHVQDSDGKTDQHTAPFYGNIDWDQLLAGLRDIGYAGELTFEAHMLIRKVPISCQNVALQMLYQLGCELKRRFDALPVA